jgi:transposase
VHANCPSPPCGTTRTRSTPGPPAARRRAVRHRRAPGRGRPPARGFRPGRECLVCPLDEGGTDALRSRDPGGPAPRLSDAQLAQVEQSLLEGATANGFVGELWTLDRIATVIQRRTGGQHHPAWVWALLHHRLGWSVQRPKRRAVERDQEAIDRWVKERWPVIKQTPNGAEPVWSSSTSPRSA